MIQKFINFYVRQENHQQFDELVAILQSRGLGVGHLLNSALPTLLDAVKNSPKPDIIKLDNIIQIR